VATSPWQARFQCEHSFGVGVGLTARNQRSAQAY